MLEIPLQAAGGALIVVSLSVLIVLLAALASAITIVQQGDQRALFVFGEFQDVLEPGLNIVPPFVSRTEPISTDQTVRIDLDDVETADGSTSSVRGRVEIRLVDVNAAFTEVDDYQSAVADVARSTTRTTVRRHESTTLRDEPHQLEHRIQDDLSDTVEDWGLVVTAVELELATPLATTQ